MIAPLTSDSRMIPFLEEKVVSSDPIERFAAAFFLAKYQADSASLLSSARDVLRMHQGKIEHAGTKDKALMTVIRADNGSDFSLLAEVACADSNEWLRARALGALVEKAKIGNVQARAYIEQIRDQSGFADTRDRAKMHLEKLR